ncbi:hypothetical protein D3C77_522750 [compost metagenome]
MILPAPGHSHRTGEVVRGSHREYAKRRQIVHTGHTVNHFIQRAVAAGRNNNIIAAPYRLSRFPCCIALASRCVTRRLNASKVKTIQHIRQQAPHLLPSGGRIIDQPSSFHCVNATRLS